MAKIEFCRESVKVSVWREMRGILIAVVTLIAIELLSRTGFKVPESAPVYLTAVVYAAFSGGLRSGLISAVITLLYAVYFFSAPGKLFHYTDDNYSRLIVLAVVTPAIAAMVGILKRRTEFLAREQAEEGLRESESRFRRLVESNMIGVIFWDTSGKITDANDAFLQMVGYTRLDLQAGKLNWKDMTPVEQMDLSDSAILQLKQRGTNDPIEKEYIRKDGNRIPVLLGGAFFEGSVEQGVSFVLDLTARKQVEEALKESEERFRFLAELIPQIVWTARPDGWLDYYNQRWFDYTGMTLEQTQGWGWGPVLHPDDLQLCIDTWTQATATGESYEVEYRFKRASDGQYRWHLGRALPLRDHNGRIIKWFGTCTDIDDQKRAIQERDELLVREQAARAQAEASNRLKDEFLAVVSHELRSPLNAILGWVQMLRAGRLNQETTARALETIERNARSQTQLIEDLLDVSRIITGKLRLNVRTCELVPIIQAALDTVRPAADVKDIRLQTLLDPSAEPIFGDSDRLQQVIWNLLSNAVKFTPKGGRVQCRLERINSHIEIAVSDTGIGISPDFLPYVFERFRQADSSSTRSYSGLGLGLSIVRHLVELHGGTVRAESPGAGLGTTFTVKLPLMPVRTVGSGAERIHPKVSKGVPFDNPPALDGLRVLVVDDEADAREFITTVLEECGAEVKAVPSAEDALLEIKQWKPNVLVSDIGMPLLDGYSLIRKVRSLGADQGGRIPAAALTAFARTEDRTRALKEGFQIHLPKPVEPAELATVVASLARRTG